MSINWEVYSERRTDLKLAQLTPNVTLDLYTYFVQRHHEWELGISIKVTPTDRIYKQFSFTDADLEANDWEHGQAKAESMALEYLGSMAKKAAEATAILTPQDC